MLNSLLEKIQQILRSKQPGHAPPPPDISRVIPLRPEVASTDRAATQRDPSNGLVDTMEMADGAEAAVADLSAQFDAWLQADLERLETAWELAQSDKDDDTLWSDLFTCAHNIRGVAGSYGYPAISRLCGSLCALLEAPSARNNFGLINLHIQACRSASIVIGRNDNEQSATDAVCSALEQKVHASLTG